MASIDNLKAMLHNRFSDGRTKLACYVNQKRPSAMKCIIIFYTGENSFCTETRASYYNNSVQVIVRHNDYNKARNLIYDILEYINANRKAYSTVYIDPTIVPVYLGEDEEQGGYVWGFDIILRGAK